MVCSLMLENQQAANDGPDCTCYSENECNGKFFYTVKTQISKTMLKGHSPVEFFFARIRWFVDIINFKAYNEQW